METRADTTSCKIIHSFDTRLKANTLYPLGHILPQLAHNTASNKPSNATIIDLSALMPTQQERAPHLFTVWVCPVSTPSLFSMSCVCQHIHRHLLAGDGMVVTLFNDLGGDGGEPGTFLVGLKKVDGKMRCVPANFSKAEKSAVREAVAVEEDGVV
jgi:hypothetical protein